MTLGRRDDGSDGVALGQLEAFHYRFYQPVLGSWQASYFANFE